MTTQPALPTRAERLLEFAVARSVHADSIVGDLRETYNDVARKRSAVHAGWWYRGQALRLILRYGVRDRLKAQTRSGARRSVILSDGLWKRRFGGEPSIIGQAILVDGAPDPERQRRCKTNELPRGLADEASPPRANRLQCGDERYRSRRRSNVSGSNRGRARAFGAGGGGHRLDAEDRRHRRSSSAHVVDEWRRGPRARGRCRRGSGRAVLRPDPIGPVKPG